MCPAEFDASDYWESRLGSHVGLKGVGWLGLGESFNRWMYGVRARVFVTLLRHVAGSEIPRLRVLDVGSGSGFYHDLWRRLGVREVVASDLTDVAVERLRARRPGSQVMKLDIGTDAVPKATPLYDAISAMDVLFHIVDDEAYQRAFRDLSSLLRPDGLLILSENFLARSTVRGAHQVSRSKAAIAEILEQAGFEQLELRPMFVLMNSPVDSSSRPLNAWWSLLTRVVPVHDSVGFMLGAALYPLELALLHLVAKGPSTKLWVGRKR